MKRRVFLHEGRRYTLVVLGEDSLLESALDVVQGLITRADLPLGSIIEVEGCTVTIEKEKEVTMAWP